MQDLRKKEYFVKKSVLKRERKNLAKLRNHYKTLKEKQNNH